MSDTKQRLLVVEDEFDLAELYREEFPNAIEVVNLRESEPGSAWAEFCHKIGSADLVLLDAIEYPFCFRRVLKLAESLRKPVIVVSGRFKEELGAEVDTPTVKFIQKPFQILELRALVETLTRSQLRLSS